MRATLEELRQLASRFRPQAALRPTTGSCEKESERDYITTCCCFFFSFFSPPPNFSNPFSARNEDSVQLWRASCGRSGAWPTGRPNSLAPAEFQRRGSRERRHCARCTDDSKTCTYRRALSRFLSKRNLSTHLSSHVSRLISDQWWARVSGAAMEFRTITISHWARSGLGAWAGRSSFRSTNKPDSWRRAWRAPRALVHRQSRSQSRRRAARHTNGATRGPKTGTVSARSERVRCAAAGALPFSSRLSPIALTSSERLRPAGNSQQQGALGRR